MRILFLHGWRSVTGGVKPTYLASQGHEVINPALDDDDFAAALQTAQTAFDEHRPDVIVGSSRGGAVAMNVNSGETPLVLLCPAWKNWGTVRRLKNDAVILHSPADDVIPFEDSAELIASSGLSPSTLVNIGNDHRLADPEPLQAMHDACVMLERNHRQSLLDHRAISGRYLFPQPRRVPQPLMVQMPGATLACYHQVVDPAAYTLVHFHGNGEAVDDYVPVMSGAFADLGLNALFVEYRQYGGSTGIAQLRAMLGDGELAMQAAGVEASRAIALGRSIGSLYAIELSRRQPDLAGLILESGIAEPAERFLTYANVEAAGLQESDVLLEVDRYFNHRAKLGAYHNPLLVLHTENDGLIDISHAERNFEWAASTQKEFVRFPRGNHNTIFGMNHPEYLAAIRRMVEGLPG